MKKGLKFTREQLNDLYHKQKLSLTKIGEIYNCCDTNILYWLKKFEIERRPAYFKKVNIRKEVLEDLYWNRNLSSTEIGKKFGINGRTVRKKLKKLGIPRKTLSQAGTKKFKAPFSGDLAEKAYFLGLRAGDFYAKRIKKCIRIQTTTTHQAQVDLLEDSFKKYGELRTYLSKNKKRADEWFIYVDLQPSFEFLLNKPTKIPEWILSNDVYFYNFLAAYMDCEGMWKIFRSHRNSARFLFRIVSGDLEILKNIKRKIENNGFHPRFYLRHKRGHVAPYGKFNLNMYDLIIYQKKDVLLLVDKLMSISKHSEKIRKMNLILESKNKTWKETEPSWINLTEEIKKEILKNQLNK